MKKYKRKTISLETEKGFKQAENLKARGWLISTVGFMTIEMFKIVEVN